MVPAVESETSDLTASKFRETMLAHYRWMLLARISEEKIVSLYRAGKIQGGVFLGKGQEAVSAALGMSLRPGDVFAPLIRDQAGRLAFGEDLLDSFRTYLGSKLGPMRGRDGNVHRGRPLQGLLPMISHLGAIIPVVNGVLMAKRFQGQQDFVGASCLGEGGTSTGAFHEAMNQAAVEKLPLVMVVANNQYAYSTPNARQFACANLVDRASGYGLAGHEVDGTNPEDCVQVISQAVAAARAGGGPQLVVARLLRLTGHAEHDDGQYMDHGLKISPLGRDCLAVADELLVERGHATASQLAELRKEVQGRVDAAANTVLREPAPDASEDDWRALATQHLAEGYFSS